MKQVPFERIICNRKEDMDIIIVSNFLKDYCKNNKVKRIIHLACQGIPVSAFKFNREMHRMFSGINYIDAIDKCKFYEIEEYELNCYNYEEILKKKEKKMQKLIFKIQKMKIENYDKNYIKKMTKILEKERLSYDKLVLEYFESRL